MPKCYHEEVDTHIIVHVKNDLFSGRQEKRWGKNCWHRYIVILTGHLPTLQNDTNLNDILCSTWSQEASVKIRQLSSKPFTPTTAISQVFIRLQRFEVVLCASTSYILIFDEARIDIFCYQKQNALQCHTNRTILGLASGWLRTVLAKTFHPLRTLV